MESTLLTYYFPSQPYPLEVSTNNHSANGSLTVVVSDPAGNVYAQGIDIFLPIGAGQPGYLSSSTPSASCNTSRWVIGSARVVKPADLPAVLRTRGNEDEPISYIQYICRPETAADQLIDFDLQFNFQIIGVDTLTGPYMIGIGETATQTAGGVGTTVWVMYTALKTQAAFKLKNFIASATNGDLNVPIGTVERNTAFQLSWESNGSQFALYTAQNPTPIYSGSNTGFTVTEGISTDTTFILQATLTNDSSAGASFESSVLYDTLTITCSNADLITNSITNAGEISSTGDIKTQGSLVADGGATFGSLTVNGKSELSDISGVSVMTDVAAFGSLNTQVNWTNFLQAKSVNVSETFTGQDANFQIFSPPQLLLQTPNFSGTQNFRAETDGIVMVLAEVKTTPGDTDGQWTLSTFIFVNPANPNTLAYNGAGNLGSFIKMTTFSVPVMKGDSFGLQFWGTYHSKESYPTAKFYFFGLGHGGATDLGRT